MTASSSLPAAFFKIVLVLCLTSSIWAETWIQADYLYDGQSSSFQGPSTVVVRDRTIAAIKEGHPKPPAGVELIRLEKSTLLPGFIDCHVHLSGEFSPGAYARKFTWDPARYAIQSTVFAKRTLDAGFTTVRDLGDLSPGSTVVLGLKKSIDSGIVPGPRILCAGKALATMGGHADPSNGTSSVYLRAPGPRQGVLSGPIEAQEAVRWRYKNGADCIKLTATGGVLSLAKSSDNPQFTDEELAAVVSTAKDYNLKVAVHAHGAVGMLRAVEAGVDSIEHGTYINDEIIAAMKARGTFLVPTLLAGEEVLIRGQQEGFFPKMVARKAVTVGQYMKDNFPNVAKSGVRIAFGTDAGVFSHGKNAGEFRLLVRAGMSPIDALRSAGIEAATLLGVEDEVGTISVGKRADLVAVPGDPRQDISLTEKVHFVMKDGAVHLRK